MSRRSPLSRRRLLAILPAVLALRGSTASAQSVGEADRGIGGTGAAPEERLGEDRGIGGTGVIGTIRRFGSIVVNDLRITFPRSVAVTIDGRGASLKALKLGHVVQVLASQEAGFLSTRAIAAVSEVLGPVSAVDHGRMTVLGQEVDLPRPLNAGRWRIGDVVAVSGLRRLDGIIVASLVERRPRGLVRLAGPVVAARDGTLRIGGLALAGLEARHAGTRVAVIGHVEGGVLRVARMAADPFAAIDARPSHVSIEAYVARDANGLRCGSGLSIEARHALAFVAEADHPVHAIVSANVEADGALSFQSLRVTSDGHDRHGGDMHGAGPGPAGAPGPAPSGPAPTGMPPAGMAPQGMPQGVVGTPPPGFGGFAPPGTPGHDPGFGGAPGFGRSGSRP